MSLLSELCSICYEQKPKYRCPRCKTGTCSLPCYKRHQQRASCNGQRDPAEYLKKSQVATPSGIDRDYNYLKGVERDIDNASRETWDRGIGSKNVTKSFSRGTHPDSKLQHYLNRNRIIMTRAPKGMSRQKTNQTRTTKRGHMMWTVEWIDSDGRSEVQHNCLETTTIEDTYAAGLAEKAHIEDRKLHSEDTADKRGKKRKRQEQLVVKQGETVATEKDEVPNVIQDPPAEGDQEVEANDDRRLQSQDASAITHSDIRAEEDVAVNDEESEAGDENETEAPQVEGESIKDEQDMQIQDLTSVQDDTMTTSLGDAKDTSQPIGKSLDTTKDATHKPDRFFYLLKANTSSACKVLIPLMPNCTLTESLQGQTVLEYPTYYVMPCSPGKLPPGFLTEHQYLKIRKSEEEELEEAMMKAEEGGVLDGKNKVKNEPGAASNSNKMDANKILDMLKRDVTR